MLEECSYCHRKFRFDRIAKHETRCPESKPKPAKLDVVRKLLAGTPGEQHIPSARQDVLSGKKLPPLPVKPKSDTLFLTDDLEECSRCGRRFSQEALAKHTAHCNATPRRASTPREGTRVQSRQGRGGQLTGRSSRSRESKEARPSSASLPEQKAHASGKVRTNSDSHRGVADHSSGGASGQPSYEQLEVDVSSWLDDI